MSEQKAEQISGEQGSVRAEPAIPNVAETPTKPVTAAAQETTPEQASAAPPVVPEQGASEPSRADAFNTAMRSAETLKAEALKTDAPQTDAQKKETPANDKADNVVTISPNDRAWYDKVPAPERETEQSAAKPGMRRFTTMAAAIVLAALTGAIGGALATGAFKRSGGEATASDAARALQSSVARIEADIAALKTSVDHNAKQGMGQFSKANERLDRLEKAQAEPAAKLAKITEAVERLRVPALASASAAAPASAPAAAPSPPPAQKDVTGSISTVAVPLPRPAQRETSGSISTAAATAPPAATPPKTELGRLPTVDGWVLRDVSRGGALIESRHGIYEVYAGDPVPGLGRVDAIRRQDGRWVVVTSKGLIVAR